MVTADDLIEIRLSEADNAFIGARACDTMFCGRSFRDQSDRREMLRVDQIVGHASAYAATKHLFGTPEKYAVSRWYAAMYPDRGDGGSDIPGANIDIKASMMRYSQDPLSYNLLVRPQERHDQTVYVHCLIPRFDQKPDRVVLTGWATDRMLPTTVCESGPLAGAYVLSVRSLNPLPPYRWWVYPGGAAVTGERPVSEFSSN